MKNEVSRFFFTSYKSKKKDVGWTARDIVRALRQLIHQTSDLRYLYLGVRFSVFFDYDCSMFFLLLDFVVTEEVWLERRHWSRRFRAGSYLLFFAEFVFFIFHFFYNIIFDICSVLKLLMI